MLDQASAAQGLHPRRPRAGARPGRDVPHPRRRRGADAAPRGPLPRLVRGAPALRRRPDARLHRRPRRLGPAHAARGRPLPLGGAHAVLLESTLGDRAAQPRQLRRGRCCARSPPWSSGGGCAVFPASSLGRAQELAALLERGHGGRLDPGAAGAHVAARARVLDRYRAGRPRRLAQRRRLPGRRSTSAPTPTPEEIVSEAGYVIASGASGLHRAARALLVLAAAAQEELRRLLHRLLRPQRAAADARRHARAWSRTTDACSRRPSPAAGSGSRRPTIRTATSSRPSVAALDRDVPVLLVHGGEDAEAPPRRPAAQRGPPRRPRAPRRRPRHHRPRLTTRVGGAARVPSPGGTTRAETSGPGAAVSQLLEAFGVQIPRLALRHGGAAADVRRGVSDVTPLPPA